MDPHRVADFVEIVRDTLDALEPVDDRERSSRERALAEIERLERPFDRDADRVHLTASAVVVGKEGTLLHLHKKLGLWLQPGGHIDEGEAPWAAALREIEEETGLRGRFILAPPTLLHIDVHDAGEHTHLDLRYLVAASGRPCPPADESQKVAWFAWERALAIADAGLVGALRAALDRLHD